MTNLNVSPKSQLSYFSKSQLSRLLVLEVLVLMPYLAARFDLRGFTLEHCPNSTAKVGVRDSIMKEGGLRALLLYNRLTPSGRGATVYTRAAWTPQTGLATNLNGDLNELAG